MVTGFSDDDFSWRSPLFTQPTFPPIVMPACVERRLPFMQVVVISVRRTNHEIATRKIVPVIIDVVNFRAFGQWLPKYTFTDGNVHTLAVALRVSSARLS